MRKNLCKVLSLFLFAVSAEVAAQNKFKVGLDAGYTYSVLDANLSNLVDSKYSGRYGLGVNLSGEYIIWESLFVTTGLSYLQKNYLFERTGSKTGWYTRYNNDYLSMPLMVGGYVLNNTHGKKGVWLKLAGGMYSEYWLSMKREGQYPVFSELQEDGSNNYVKVSDRYDFDKNENHLNRFGYGLQGQAQLGYSFDKFNVYGAFNYQYGLSDINLSNTDKNQKSSNRSYMISIGAAYKFD